MLPSRACAFAWCCCCSRFWPWLPGTSAFGPYRLRRLVAATATEAVERARTEFKIELDFSESSVEKVEEIAARALAQPRFSEERRAELAKLFGVYLGEVARRNHGGEWLIPQGGPMAGALVLQGKGGQSSPPSKVYKRLANGGEDNLTVYYELLVKASRPVRDRDHD